MIQKKKKKKKEEDRVIRLQKLIFGLCIDLV
jgi:hypothetical protein